MCRVRKIICKTEICRPKSSCPEEQQQQQQQQQEVISALLEPAFRNSVAAQVKNKGVRINIISSREDWDKAQN